MEVPTMKLKPPELSISSTFAVAFKRFLKLGYPDLNIEDIERMDEIISAIPKDEFRREDFICSLDQAYCEARGRKRRFTRKTFAQ